MITSTFKFGCPGQHLIGRHASGVPVRRARALQAPRAFLTSATRLYPTFRNTNLTSSLSLTCSRIIVVWSSGRLRHANVLLDVCFDPEVLQSIVDACNDGHLAPRVPRPDTFAQASRRCSFCTRHSTVSSMANRQPLADDAESAFQTRCITNLSGID
ncbi:unnamed protein product (mitochondrion) [Plasmodiophora brassicae]|uniref:Uncharacterized protein n=1 Tax=Plasmodiophora brassicae TaxID=37360 RepID=A0A3P3YH10_PLABS|nr:unnamed protein product [Plasmodiophora brassicae]